MCARFEIKEYRDDVRTLLTLDGFVVEARLDAGLVALASIKTAHINGQLILTTRNDPRLVAHRTPQLSTSPPST